MSYDAKSPNQDYPFFRLGGLPLSEARDRVGAIRLHLELRKREAKKQSALGVPTGHRYAERIEAYLGWTIAAASLLKQHSKALHARTNRPSRLCAAGMRSGLEGAVCAWCCHPCSARV